MWTCPMLNCTQQPEDAWCQDENILLIRAMRDSNAGISYFVTGFRHGLSPCCHSRAIRSHFQSRIQIHLYICSYLQLTIYIPSSMTHCFQSKQTCMFSYQHPTQGAKVLVRWLAALLRNRERSLPWHWGGSPKHPQQAAYVEFVDRGNFPKKWTTVHEVWKGCKSSSNILSWMICDTFWVRCRTMTTVLWLQPLMLAASC